MDSYDYIVVGAGSAKSIVADRLTPEDNTMTLQLTDSEGCSGHGRELGAHGLREFFCLKSMQR
jgi:hypothetical protein